MCARYKTSASFCASTLGHNWATSTEWGSDRLNYGSDDDLVEDPELRQGRPHLRRAQRSRSRARGGQKRKERNEPEQLPQEEGAPQDDLNEYTPSQPVPGLAEVEGEPELPAREEADGRRLVSDLQYFPFPEPAHGPLFEREPFLRARQRHERWKGLNMFNEKNYLRRQDPDAEQSLRQIQGEADHLSPRAQPSTMSRLKTMRTMSSV